MRTDSPFTNTRRPNVAQGSSAFSRTELLLVLGTVGLLSAVALPLLATPRPQQHLAVCANNLRQIGQAFLSFADTHGDQLPPRLPLQSGGSASDFSVGSIFRAVSNELSSTRLLVCPSSRRPSAPSFAALRDLHTSYLFGAHAAPDRSWEILSGDFDIQGGIAAQCTYIGRAAVTWFPGSVGVPDTFFVSWSATNHVASGNLLRSDGSVSNGDSKDLQRSIANSAREGSQSVHILTPR